MSIEEMKDLFGTQETVLELVQIEEGVLALRAAGSEDRPLVKIEFNDDVLKVLGDHTPAIAQHMIQAAIFGVMEQQVNKKHAQIIDDQPSVYS